MRKIVMLLIVFLSFGFVWGQYADTNPLANTPGYTEEQQSDIDNQFIDNIDIPDTSSQEEDVADLVGTSYCASKWAGDTSQIPACLDCFSNGAIYDGSSCIMIEQFCSDAFEAGSEGLVECVENYNTCTADGGTPDRCSCKAIGGISLNTNVPFVGNCISLSRSSNPNTTEVTPDTAFPLLIVAITKIMMTVILIFCFLALIVGGVMMSMGGSDESKYTDGKKLITHVIIALALLGSSGVILRIINPSFFG